MKIVVTGATSFVGLGAVRELLHRGHQVYAVLREHSTKADLLRENGKFPQGLTILEEDLGNLSKLPERIHGGCDVFLHMGWRGAGSDSRKNEAVQEESVQDALNAVRVAKELGCRRFLFTGSQAEYGVKSELTDEEAVCEPTSPYGRAKLAVRQQTVQLVAHLDAVHFSQLDIQYRQLVQAVFFPHAVQQCFPGFKKRQHYFFSLKIDPQALSGSLQQLTVVIAYGYPVHLVPSLIARYM